MDSFLKVFIETLTMVQSYTVTLLALVGFMFTVLRRLMIFPFMEKRLSLPLESAIIFAHTVTNLSINTTLSYRFIIEEPDGWLFILFYYSDRRSP